MTLIALALFHGSISRSRAAASPAPAKFGMRPCGGKRKARHALSGKPVPNPLPRSALVGEAPGHEGKWRARPSDSQGRDLTHEKSRRDPRLARAEPDEAVRTGRNIRRIALAAEGVARFPFPPHGRIPISRVPSWQPHDSLRSSRGRAPQRSRSIRIHRNARCEPRRCAAASCVSVSCRQRRPENMILPKKINQQVNCFTYCPQKPA